MDLIELRPHRGAVVAGLDPERLAELFEAMAEIEAACARLAAVKMSGPAGARSRSCGSVRRRPARGRYRGGAYANQAFHSAIHEGAGNEFLADAALCACAGGWAALPRPVRLDRTPGSLGGGAHRR